jgi:monothiol glutaredoxin
MSNIILYSKTGCPWGDEVRDFLNLKNIPFEEREMLGNPAFKDECIAKSGQWKCPTLDIDGHLLADTDAKAVEEYLGKISKS